MIPIYGLHLLRFDEKIVQEFTDKTLLLKMYNNFTKSLKEDHVPIIEFREKNCEWIDVYAIYPSLVLKLTFTLVPQ